MGHDAFLQRHVDGTVTVEHADPVIWVADSLLDQAEAWVFPNGTWDVIQLDTAGEYRYRLTDQAAPAHYLVYERITT